MVVQPHGASEGHSEAKEGPDQGARFVPWSASNCSAISTGANRMRRHGVGKSLCSPPLLSCFWPQGLSHGVAGSVGVFWNGCVCGGGLVLACPRKCFWTFFANMFLWQRNFQSYVFSCLFSQFWCSFWGKRWAKTRPWPAYIYIYMYTHRCHICVVRLGSGPIWGGFEVRLCTNYSFNFSCFASSSGATGFLFYWLTEKKLAFWKLGSGAIWFFDQKLVQNLTFAKMAFF